LLAGLAVGFPVLFHLIRRTTRQRTEFSSLMFLFPTPPRLTQRSRLEHILLLLLRCAAICLLAVGFSRPFFRKPVNSSASGSAKRVLVLVDTSASMRRANLWADARDKVQSLVRQTAPGDQLALFAFDRTVRSLMSFDQWNAAPLGERGALALRALTDITPGWGATRLDGALLRGAEILADTGTKQTPGPGEIVLISDLQEGSHLESLQGSEWPRNVHVSVELLKPRHVSNASLQLVADSEDGDSKAPGEIRIRISNATDSKRDQFKVGWSRPDGLGFEGNPAEVYVPPGQNRVISLPSSTNGAVVDHVLLQGDEEDFDNSLYVLPPEVVRRNVLYLGAESATDPKQPLYFLKRAFQETRREVVRVQAQAPNQPISDADLAATHMLIIGDSLPANVASSFRSSLTAGKTALLVLRDRAVAQTLAGLLGLNELEVTEVQPANYAMLGEIDLRDPLFAPFADPRFSDFTGIHFWKYRRVELTTIPQARALARFDSGDPALFEVPVGRGRILVLTSGWGPQDSQLALSTKFVPLLYSILETSGESSPASTRYFVGDSVPVSPIPDTSLKVLTPDNKKVDLVAGESNFSATFMPGVYSLVSGQTVKRFAVNLDPSESRTAPLSVDDLEHLGVPLKRTETLAAVAAQRNLRLKNADLENHQKLWRWLLVGALVVLLVETWFAGRLHYRPTGGVDLKPGLEYGPGDRERAPVSAIS
jgi:hypothetical protein